MSPAGYPDILQERQGDSGRTNLSPRKELVGLFVPWHRPSDVPKESASDVSKPPIPAAPPEAGGEHLLGGHAEGEVPRHSPSSGLPFAA